MRRRIHVKSYEEDTFQESSVSRILVVCMYVCTDVTYVYMYAMCVDKLFTQ